MKTLWLLVARYEGMAIIPAELVVRDFFQHLETPTFVRKVSEGEIDIPLVRIEGSNKAAKGVALVDLAAYIDRKIEEARKENDQIFNRDWRRRASKSHGE